VMIIGARVGDRAMSAAEKIAQKAEIIHIDIDPAEIGKNIEAAIPVVGDARLVLEDLNKLVEEKGDVEDWNKKIKKVKREHSVSLAGDTQSGFVNPKYLLSILSKIVDHDTVVTTEVGQNQIWAANYYSARKPRTFISSGGMGTMGYGLPAAVGVKIGSPRSKVITISGDGSFQMSMQELGTIKQNNLGVKVIIFNNSRLGMVSELQKVKYSCRYSQVCLRSNPDFVKIAEAYGFKGKRISNNSQIEGALKDMLADDSPYLLECVVDPEESTL
jgi:acetolactate synthase-1/2/3 large subunit